MQYVAGGATQNSIRIAQWLLQVPNATSYFGAIGDDDFGRKLRETGSQGGVNVRCLLLLSYFLLIVASIDKSYLRPSSSFSQGPHALLILKTNTAFFRLLAAAQGLAEAKWRWSLVLLSCVLPATSHLYAGREGEYQSLAGSRTAQLEATLADPSWRQSVLSLRAKPRPLPAAPQLELGARLVGARNPTSKPIAVYKHPRPDKHGTSEDALPVAEQRKGEPVRTKRGTRQCRLGACARG